ncbi:Helix-turn-helix domain-containing protein [Haloechinothrix alba]|uniref:Helix-turn-helix domain-containing protein n=1 Tax=Haloechinothrix alba TaxID=664784 RepID=A0A238WMG4_9PSEU|nr:Scr1 family TA system antitoxin-like transcriptional regulator [Haloechinothrix alba]SNR46879.1 Helix-turn-helix domain-containing protein [Haloechinothrix alba]
MPPVSPTVARWELGIRLRRRRAQLGIDVQTITARLGFSRNYWSAIENDRKLLSEEKLRTLLELYEFDEDEQQELLALRESAKERGWWSRYSALFSEELLRVYGLEHGAESIRTYESLLVPGLLQTSDYARALISSDLANIRQVEVDQRVEVRMRRQQRLSGDDPLQLTAVISEAALLQQIGGTEVLSRQLEYLADMIEKYPETIELRVIPFTATAGGVLGASTFHVIEFASAELPSLAWQETVTSQGVIESETQVRDLAMTHAQALTQGLDRQESLELIRRYARG